MSEYKHTVAKGNQSGFAESPVQTESNAGSPILDDNLTLKKTVLVAAVVVQAKKVIGTTYQAISGQLGSARLEEQMATASRASMFAGLVYLSSGFGLPALVAGGEILSFGINNLVDSHMLNLANARLRATTGVRVNYNAGGYYG